MRTLASGLGALVCAGTLLGADLPDSIPVGDNAVRAYEIAGIGYYVVNLFSSPNTTPRNWSTIAVHQEVYFATNGVVDEKYIRGILQRVSQNVFSDDPAKIFALTSGFSRGVFQDAIYGTIFSGSYSLVENPDGGYLLPAQATNAPVVGFYDVGIYATGLTRARVEITDNGVVEYVLDSATTPSIVNSSKGVFACQKWILTNNYSGTITLYTGSEASATETKYDLKTGLKQVLPPSFGTAPQSQTVRAGVSVAFSALANGTLPIAYQWQFNGVAIAGATSTTLTLNNVQSGNAGRYSLRAVNAAGSAVSSAATLAVQADPANGKPATPIVFPGAPPKSPGQDSLVIITHGYQLLKPSPFPGVNVEPDLSWLTGMSGMSNVIQQKLIGKANWRVWPFLWVADAQTLNPQDALDNAIKHGRELGKAISSQAWKHVHFIGHSAGSGLIQAAAEMVKVSQIGLPTPTTVHTTFLDPFVGFGYENRITYGLLSDWSDTYFARDFTGTFTQAVPNSHSVDVTALDPDRKTMVVSKPTGNENVVSSSHGWPYVFYTRTVVGNLSDTLGYGFPLSMEGDGWANRASYPNTGSGQPVRLGYEPSFNRLPNTFPKTDYSKLTVSGAGGVPAVTSTTGTLQLNPYSIQFLNGGTLSPQSAQNLVRNNSTRVAQGLQPAGQPVLEPAWVSLGVTTTNLANYVKFEAGFTSGAGAQGLFSVYWGTNLIGSLDERTESAGLQTYQYLLPETYPDGQYTLGFRLDAYTTTPSSLTLTNVVTGFYGITNPPVLLMTANATNGPAQITLTGATGFYSLLQSSTDLTNWTSVATLVNSNGVVQFSDPSSTNQARRYYRAVVP